MSYSEEVLQEHIKYLKESMKAREGVVQGHLIYDNMGNVVDRVGRISLNPQWYQDFYRVHKRKPTNKDLEDLARSHLDNGFYDNGIFIPPYRYW